MHPTAYFYSGKSEVSYEDKKYVLGEKVNMRVEVEAGVKVEILSVGTNFSSIKEWTNQSLFSGGAKFWGSTITYKSGDKGNDYEYVFLAIPNATQLTEGVIKAEIIVYYVYASPSGDFFSDIRSTDTVKIEVKI
jgi:hypothetical protein